VVASVVIGQNNALVANDAEAAAQTSWRGGDSLFVIGNGADGGTPSNALEVLKNGTVTIKTVPAQGGIDMGVYDAQ
jgi:hypothetical protein